MLKLIHIINDYNSHIIKPYNVKNLLNDSEMCKLSKSIFKISMPSILVELLSFKAKNWNFGNKFLIGKNVISTALS